MKKRYIISTLIAIIMVISLTSALIVIQVGYQLDKDEMASVTNTQIAQYMTNEFKMVDYKLMEDRIIIYYNITYIEPTNIGNGTQYKVFTQPKPFIIEKTLWNECLSLTSKETCIGILVNNPEPFNYTIPNNLDEEYPEIIEIKSTYLQAYEEQVRQYNRAKEIRDNSISNDLDDLVTMIDIN